MKPFQKFMIDYPGTDSEIAQLLMVTRPTVRRWRSGLSEPHPFMIPGILAKLKKERK